MDFQEDQTTERVRNIPLAAMFTALGIMLPMVFHWFGLGSAFLPMFLPVLTAAMLLPRSTAAVIAFLTPIASFMLTGMPPMSPPVLPLMLVELVMMAFIASTIRRLYRKSVLVALAAVLFADRVLLFILVYSVTRVAGVEHPFFAPAIVLTGIPGIILMFAIVPAVVTFISSRFPRLAVVELRQH